MTKNRIPDLFQAAMHLRNISDGLRVTLLVCVIGLTLSFVATQSAQAQSEPAYTFSVLHSFNGTNGANPDSALHMDKEGNLFSTTPYGGDPGCIDTGGLSGCGLVFKLNKQGKESVLYKFTGNADGGNPNVGLVRDKEGNFYGTTLLGGMYGFGTMFKLDTSNNKETVLCSFTGDADGSTPDAILTLDPAGDLYGTAQAGGDLSCSNPFDFSGCGVVFKVNKTTGNETVLYTFSGGTDGSVPFSGLTRDAAGNVYGTTVVGGDSSCNGPFGPGCGVVFKVAKTGKETVLHAFKGTEGSAPEAGLYMDEEGTFYSTTFWGGESGVNGVVFKLDKTTGKLTVLHNFNGTDGANSTAGLIADAAGNFYGAASYGGASNNGVVFKLAKGTNKETVLYNFTGAADGGFPAANLIRDAAGNLYSTAFQGGNTACSGDFVTGCGVVFKLAP